MNKLITATSRGAFAASFTAVLTIAAVNAAMSGVTAAKAWDQQAAQAVANVLKERAAGGYGYSASSQRLSGPYARAHSAARWRH
jgi:hypothetical protein